MLDSTLRPRSPLTLVARQRHILSILTPRTLVLSALVAITACLINYSGYSKRGAMSPAPQSAAQRAHAPSSVPSAGQQQGLIKPL